MTEKQVDKFYPMMSRHITYGDLARWHDWLTSVPGAPADLVALVGLAASASYLRAVHPTLYKRR